MKKADVLLFVFLLILISLIAVYAQSNSTEERGYSCLKTKLGSNCGNSNNVEQLSFSLLAMSHESGIQSNCKTALINQKNNENWNNNIKQTALATLALNNIRQDTSKQEAWLLSKTKTPTELEWYLEIDSNKETSCTISYGTTKSTISISDSKKISGDAGTCLTRAYNNYWLQIDNSCLNKIFKVSCDQDFITTLLYKKSGSQVWHVSSEVNSSSAGGNTETQVNSLCFGTTTCDYEGSLWATLALQKTNNNITQFIPYLTALSEDNEKFLSYSFLYYLTNSDEHLTKLLNLQKNGYWDLSGDKFYDTAAGLLSLSNSEARTEAISWLESQQGNDGCWNSDNIKDTSFILWATFPKTPITTTETQDCENYNHYCLTDSECVDAGGTKLTNFACPGAKICCDKPFLETCSQKSGTVCPAGQSCSVATVVASDTQNCCTGTCAPETTECENANYNCRDSCLSDEQEASYDCNSGEVCCQPKPPSEGGSSWWIWILVILIILVVIAIIFRNRLRVLLFRFRGGVKKGPVTTTRPPFLPPRGVPVGLRRPVSRIMPTTRPIPRPALKQTSKADKELEETLKKLKEMSK